MNVWIPPVQFAAWFAVQQTAARWGGRRRPGPAEIATGVALAGAAALGGADALRRFIVRGTTWHPWDVDGATRLVTDGPNAWSRNPMYAGLALGLLGTGLVSGRPWTALAALGFVGTVTPQIRREEAALGRLFGDDWHAYAATVRRWV